MNYKWVAIEYANCYGYPGDYYGWMPDILFVIYDIMDGIREEIGDATV